MGVLGVSSLPPSLPAYRSSSTGPFLKVEVVHSTRQCDSRECLAKCTYEETYGRSGSIQPSAACSELQRSPVGLSSGCRSLGPLSNSGGSSWCSTSQAFESGICGWKCVVRGKNNIRQH